MLNKTQYDSLLERKERPVILIWIAIKTHDLSLQTKIPGFIKEMFLLYTY